MNPTVQQKYCHPALDYILDLLDSLPSDYPTLSPSITPGPSTPLSATCEPQAAQPLPDTAKHTLRVSLTPRTRPQQEPTLLSDVAASTSSITTRHGKQLLIHDWHALALPFRPKSHYTAPSARFPPLSPQHPSAALSQRSDVHPEVSRDDDTDAQPSCGLQERSDASERPLSKMALSFITQPSPAVSNTDDPRRHSPPSSIPSDTSSPALSLLFATAGEFGVGKEEVLQRLRETFFFAQRGSENEEERELWRWALGEEEWEPWEMSRVDEGRRWSGEGVW
ncbi:hypothetical protein MMC32_003230 [Xylographa parallela]|nr:hypothetical protein [Xylographa parallela]